MKDTMTKNLFDVPTDEADEIPEPKICPCTGVKGFLCPAKKAGELMKKCTDPEKWVYCPNFSAWYYYKITQAKAKEMEVPE